MSILGSPELPAAPAFKPANSGVFGLLPAADFKLVRGEGEGECDGCATIPQARWFFRHEQIAVPQAGQPMAGFSRTQRVYDDVAAWHAATPPGSAVDYPPLVWTASSLRADNARLSADGKRLTVGNATLPLQLAARHPLNRSYWDEHSTAFFSPRPIHVRGEWQDERFVARTLWPADFRLPESAPLRPISATPEALRARVRELPHGGADSPFAVELLWQRSGAAPMRKGKPLLAFILNGAQGDDDESHGGHFAAVTGRIGPQGAMHEWLVNNYYTLDSESEKGIIAAPVPLDNYFADLNAGQAWYRPSVMLVAVLRDPRTAAHIQSALGRVYNQFYRHQFGYQHASANCAGITVSTLRALDWRIPVRGPESWLKAIPALPLSTFESGSLSKGKAVFDYLTEDRSRLYPAVAFEEVGADLLRLAQGSTQGNAARTPSAFENLLAEDVDALLLVRIPQLPSSRVLGDFPVVSSVEYEDRVPKNPEEQQIVPVGPRPFPKDFIDPQAPKEPWLRSDYAVGAYALTLAGLLWLGLSWLGGWLKSRIRRRA